MINISTDALIQIVSILLAAITFIIAIRLEKKKDRKTTNRELYQNLEFASIDLFRFEAENLNLIKPIWERDVKMPPKETAEYTATMNYVCQMLNLFEMAIKFREDKTLPPDVFSSWIAWFFLLINAPGFPFVWEDIQDDYLPELQNIMNGGLEILDKSGSEEEKRNEFYQFVGYVLKCKIIEEWVGKKETNSYHDFINSKPGEKANAENKPKIENIEIRWLDDKFDAASLATFFIENKGKNYISHSEIQEGRAIDSQTWSEKIEIKLAYEFTESLKNEKFKKANIIGAFSDNKLVGFSLIEFNNSENYKYATVSDIIVKKEIQNQRVGAKIIDWIKIKFKSTDILTIYAESNINNKIAHNFLLKQGFQELSKVFSLTLNNKV